MKLYTRNTNSRYDKELHLVMPPAHFWGMLTIIVMLGAVISSININPNVIVLGILTNISVSLWLFMSLFRIEEVYHD